MICIFTYVYDLIVYDLIGKAMCVYLCALGDFFGFQERTTVEEEMLFVYCLLDIFAR